MGKLNGGVVFGSANSVTARKDYALLPKQATVLLPAMRLNTCSRLSASWGMRGVMSIASILHSVVVDGNHAGD